MDNQSNRRNKRKPKGLWPEILTQQITINNLLTQEIPNGYKKNFPPK